MLFRSRSNARSCSGNSFVSESCLKCMHDSLGADVLRASPKEYVFHQRILSSFDPTFSFSNSVGGAFFHFDKIFGRGGFRRFSVRVSTCEVCAHPISTDKNERAMITLGMKRAYALFSE